MWTEIINWVLSVTQNLGYAGVMILMAIESSFLPLPSEIVIPPAAYLASQGKMNLLFIILAGTVGSIIGASINYFLSMSLGRPVIYKLANTRVARFLLITPEKITKSEEYFLKSACSATFFGRLIPVVRHLISIPAGFSKMPFGRFVFYTALGSLVWVSILSGLGYWVGSNQELLAQYYKEISWGLLFFGLLWLAWKVVKTINKKNPI